MEQTFEVDMRFPSKSTPFTLQQCIRIETAASQSEARTKALAALRLEPAATELDRSKMSEVRALVLDQLNGRPPVGWRNPRAKSLGPIPFLCVPYDWP